MHWLTTAAFVLSALGRAQGQDVTALTNVRVIDGNGGQPIENAAIVIRGEQIAAVGPMESVSIPSGATVIDASGRTVLPGLADFHTHLVGGWDGDRPDLLGYRVYLNSLLYAGVTSVFDTGNILPYVQQMHQEIENGRLTGPRIYFAGPVIDGADPVWPPISYAVASVSQIPDYVRQLKSAGVHALKGYGGLSVQQLSALVAAAEQESLSVVVDAWGANGSRDIAALGIRAFAHLSTREMEDETVSLMASRDVATITTMAVIESFSRRRLSDLAFLSNDLVARATPPWVIEELTAEATRPLTEADSARAQRVAAGLQMNMLNAKRLWDAGVQLVAGTDAPYPGVFLGEGIHRELELLVEAGLTPLQAITTATKNPAMLLEEAPDWGTLEPGKRADLIVVAGNPAERISDTRGIEMVFQRGRLIDRTALEYDPDRDPGFRPGAKVSSGN